MKHDPHLANDLIIKSLIAKIEKLDAKVAGLEAEFTALRRSKKRPKPRRSIWITPGQVQTATPILEAAARINGTTVAEICGSRGDKRAILGRAEAAHDCHAAGLSPVSIGRILGNRNESSIRHLIARHKDRMGIT